MCCAGRGIPSAQHVFFIAAKCVAAAPRLGGNFVTVSVRRSAVNGITVVVMRLFGNFVAVSGRRCRG